MSLTPTTPEKLTDEQVKLYDQLAGRRVALISVWDKTGLAELARPLAEDYGYTLLATGGTKAFLAEHGIDAIETSALTGFGQLLGGRVKSLHPTVFAGILAHGAERKTVPVQVELVVVNLYPFESKVTQASKPVADAEAVEHIDIGGSAMIRAAAKNFAHVGIVADPSQYTDLLKELRMGGGETSLPFRKKLAHAAFTQSTRYDQHIANFFLGAPDPHAAPVAQRPARADVTTTGPAAPNTAGPTPLRDALTLNLTKLQDLRYGENPHQSAALYGLNHAQPDFKLLHGKELSYNNLLDLQAAWNLVSEFTPANALISGSVTPACAIIKHNNPCGVAMGVDVLEAYNRALDCDPVSAFGGIVAFNQPVTAKVAKVLKDLFLEVIVAPQMDDEALAILEAKKNLRLVIRPFAQLAHGLQHCQTLKQLTPDLVLVQQWDASEAETLPNDWTVMTQTKPNRDQQKDLDFAWRVAKHVKSNAIVLVKEQKTIGICGGQTSRIDALEQAINKAVDDTKDAVLASDGFLPNVDNIHAAAQARIAAIIQPGGSIKDPDVIAEANKHNIAMVTTGVRTFLH